MSKPYDQVTKGIVYTHTNAVRAQCVDIMFSNIYTADDWTLDHWKVLMKGYTTQNGLYSTPGMQQT